MKNKNKTLDLAGISHPGSITFFGEEGQAEVDTEDLKIPPRYVKERSHCLYSIFKKIPVIRGYAVIFDLLFEMLKNKWIILVILFFIGISLSPKEVVIQKEIIPGPLSFIIPDVFWDNYFFTIAIWLIVITYLFLATKNHAAEHKVISAYEDSENLTIKNIKKQPKENRRCGTVLVVWFFVLSLPMFYENNFLIEIFLQMTFFSFAYEVFRLARRRDTIGNIVYSLGWLGQKLTTREPDNKLLLRSRQGLIRLLDEEGYDYKK